MSKNKKDIVLSVSAITAALSTLAQVAPAPGDTTTPKIQVTHVESQHQGAIDDIMMNNAVQMKLRMSARRILPGMEVDKETMQDAWMRLALNIDVDVDTGIISGGNKTTGLGKLIGPMEDSTLDDRLSQEKVGVQGCYSNCHAACHGSRGWR
jgi:hypothetical protein